MRLRAILAPMLASTGILAACGGPAPVEFDSLERAFATKFCEQLTRCPDPSFGRAFTGFVAAHPVATTCADFYVRTGELNLDELEASIDAGRIRYDGVAAAACLADLDDTCTLVGVEIDTNAHCQRAFVGLVRRGGTCARDGECAGSNNCDFSAGCPGTCQPAATRGEACDVLACDRSYLGGTLLCGVTTDNPNPHCIAVTYVTAGVGETCGNGAAMGDALDVGTCAAGLYCRRVDLNAPTGTCAKSIPVGQSCTPNIDACDADSTCASVGGASAKCTAMSVATTVGAACAAGSPESCNWLARLQCVAGHCELIGSGALDEKCAVATDCNDGLYCSGAAPSGLCKELIADGQPCSPNSPEACESGHCDAHTDPLAPVCGVVQLCE